MSPASCNADGSRSSCGTTRETSPISRASLASMMRPVKRSSAARSRPTREARRPIPATSQHRPRFTNSSPKRARSDATRMSAITASSMPQPTAAPFTAAITGTSVSRSALAAGVMRGSARSRSPVCSPAASMTCFTSSPEQKAGSAPVMTRQRAVVVCTASVSSA